MHFIKRNRLEKHPQAELQVNEEETPTLHSSTQSHFLYTQITNKPVDSHLALAGGTATFWRPPPPIWGCPEPAGTTAAA